MKKMILALILTSFSLNGFSKIWTITSSGTTFSPATITMVHGDSVNFAIASIHNAVEVSQTVWNANGNSPVIGFSVPYGGGTVLPASLAAGTHYYVCTPHATFGMKGIIIVQAATGLDKTINEGNISVYPNPVMDHLNIQLDFAESSNVELKLYDIQGKLMSTLVPKTFVAGSFSQSFARQNEWSPGIYLLKISIGERALFRKVVFL